jgi:hypothetical protein
MPLKPSFRVKLPPKQQENAPLHPPMTTSFALPGTLAERKAQRKSQRELNFNSSHVQKTRLAEWDLNTPSTSASLLRSSTTIVYGMPTPQTPLSLLDTGHSESYVEVSDSAGWKEAHALAYDNINLSTSIFEGWDMIENLRPRLRVNNIHDNI